MKNTADLDKKYQALLAQNAQLQCLLEQEKKKNQQQKKQNKLLNKQLEAQLDLAKEKEALAQEKETLVQEKETQIQSLRTEIDFLKERLAILLSKRFKAQSEQLKHIQAQLFDEAELEKAIQETREAIEALENTEAKTDDEANNSERKTTAQEKAKPKRKPLPDHLRRVDVIVDVSDEDKQAMGDEWEHIGFETSEQLAVQQREYYVKVIKRKKYVRITAQQSQADDELPPGIKVAPPAKVILPRAIADASLLADVLCSKFIDAMSFYRTEKRLLREGIDIGYSTLCDWALQLYDRLTPFHKLFYEALAQSPLWQLDETTLQVLNEPGRHNQQTSYLWSVRAGPPDRPMVLFHYSPRRTFEVLEQWLCPCLAIFCGVIVTDEYSAYNMLVNNYTNIKGHGGCLAHCRRKFADAAKGRRHGSDAHHVLQKIALIYAQEHKTAHLSGADRVEARLRLVKPRLDELKNLLDALAPKYLNKGAMKTAIHYALNNWHKFNAFLDHPEMPIDNNAMEQAIRPFTLGRKNWLFAGSPRGAEASAFIYSIIESAKANGLEPYAYLKALFEAYPHATNDDERRQLLPWNFKNSV